MINPSVEKLQIEAQNLASHFNTRQIDSAYAVAVFCLMLRENAKTATMEEKVTIERMVHRALFGEAN